jgi:hypothetical protein
LDDPPGGHSNGGCLLSKKNGQFSGHHREKNEDGENERKPWK